MMIEIFAFWISGWILLSVGCFIYNWYYERNLSMTKKLVIYNSFKYGILSWIGIFFILGFLIAMSVAMLDDRITDKLNK